MLNFKLPRINPDNIEQEYTHGFLLVEDSQGKFIDVCHTLEDTVRDINKNGVFDGDEKKIYGRTAIPFGKYKGQVTYSNTFKREMPAIFNVSEFSGIRMHGGNDDRDTLGCVLVAHNTDNKGKIWGSAEREITNLIKRNDPEGKFTIEII